MKLKLEFPTFYSWSHSDPVGLAKKLSKSFPLQDALTHSDSSEAEQSRNQERNTSKSEKLMPTTVPIVPSPL